MKYSGRSNLEGKLHTDNIAMDLGRSLSYDPASRTVLNDPEAKELLARKFGTPAYIQIPLRCHRPLRPTELDKQQPVKHMNLKNTILSLGLA